MKIRPEQMAVFQAQVEADFLRRVASYLRERHPDVVTGLPEATFERRVRGAVSRARSHGFTWESAIVGYALLVFEVSPNFDRQPDVARELRRSHPDENERIDRVLQLPERVWQQVPRPDTPQAWTELEKEAAP